MGFKEKQTKPNVCPSTVEVWRLKLKSFISATGSWSERHVVNKVEIQKEQWGKICIWCTVDFSSFPIYKEWRSLSFSLEMHQSDIDICDAHASDVLVQLLMKFVTESACKQKKRFSVSDWHRPIRNVRYQNQICASLLEKTKLFKFTNKTQNGIWTSQDLPKIKEAIKSVELGKQGRDGDYYFWRDSCGTSFGWRKTRTQLLEQVPSVWGTATHQQTKITVHASSSCTSIHLSIHPSVRPCSTIRPTAGWARSQQAAVCAHLGTVHVCSGRRGLARNRSWACRAFANRLAGIWGQKCGRGEEGEGGKKKKALRRQKKKKKKGEAGSGKLRRLSENEPGDLGLDSWMETIRSCLRLPVVSLWADAADSNSNIRANETETSETRLKRLPYPSVLRRAALSSCFSSAPRN